MKSFKVGPRCSWLVVVGLLAFVVTVAWSLAANAVSGWTIRINAINLSTTDTAVCGGGEGLRGDKLQVNVFTDLSGVSSGTATFEDATGHITTLNIDTVLGFGPGIVLIDSSTNNAVPIWLDDTIAPARVTVEIPRGCENTICTFTLGVDPVRLQITF